MSGGIQPGGGGPAGVIVASGRLERTQWRQLAIITAAAIGIFFGLRALPTGTNLSHMDFRVDPRAGKAIEFCDPSNPQFIPVVAVRSPVVMTVATAAAARVGQPVRGTITLKTASGKPVGAEDLLHTHTRKMHLLIVDESLTDYQHVHPDPAAVRGEWLFAFTPHQSGGYRVFADFTPAATSRGLYASVDLPVGARADGVAASASEWPGRKTAPLAGARGYELETRNSKLETGATPLAHARGHGGAVEREGYRFALTSVAPPIQAGRAAELALEVTRIDGGAVPLEPVMDALAHLVAFDTKRSGFAHLHPIESDVDRAAGPTRPVLRFRLMIPAAGPYVIWAQLNLAGREIYVPFWFDVVSASGGNQG